MLPLCFNLAAGIALPADQVKRTGQTEDVVTKDHEYIFACDKDSTLFKNCKAVQARCDVYGNVFTDTSDKNCADKTKCKCKKNPKYEAPKAAKVDTTKTTTVKNGELDCGMTPIPGIKSMTRNQHCQDRGYTCVAMKIQLKGDLGAAGKDENCSKCTCK